MGERDAHHDPPSLPPRIVPGRIWWSGAAADSWGEEDGLSEVCFDDSVVGTPQVRSLQHLIVVVPTRGNQR